MLFGLKTANLAPDRPSQTGVSQRESPALYLEKLLES